MASLGSTSAMTYHRRMAGAFAEWWTEKARRVDDKSTRDMLLSCAAEMRAVSIGQIASRVTDEIGHPDAPTETVEQECDHDWEFIGGLANSEGLNGVCRKCRARHHDRETVEQEDDFASSLVTHPQTCPWCKGDGGPCVHCGVEQEEDDCRHAYICQKCGGGRFDDPEDAVKWLSDGEDDIVERWHAAVEAYQFQHLSDPWDFVKIGNQMADEIAHLRSVCDGARQQEQEWAALTDRAIALIRRLRRSAPREVGWRPIETAPKDESYVLISGTAGVHIAHWTSWRWEGWKNFEGRGVGEPTHWMPLPDPPVGPPTGDEEGQE